MKFRHKKRMRYGAAALVVCGMLALASCAGGTRDATGAPYEPAPEGEQVELTIWFGREQYAPGTGFEAFEEMYPNIKVKVDTIPLETAPANFIRQTQSGGGPDIFQSDDTAIGNLAIRGLLYDLAPIRKTWEEDNPDLYNVMTQSAWDLSTFNDKVYGLTLHHAPQWNIYRNDIFEKHGLEVPKTWEDVLDIGVALKEKEPGMYGIAINGSRDFQPLWDKSIFAQMGGQWKDGVMQIDSEEGHYWLNWYQRALKLGVIDPDSIAYTWPNQIANFAQGKAAMTTMSQNVYPTEILPSLAYGKQFLVNPEPIAKPGSEAQSRYITNGWPYMVNAATKHPYEVGLLLQYLADDPQTLEIAKRYHAASNSRVMESKEYLSSAPWGDALAEPWTTLDPRPRHVNQAAMDGVIRDAMQAALNDPDGDVKEMAVKYQMQLDNLAAAVPTG